MTPLVIDLSAADWLALFLNFCAWSLLAVGGAISMAPDMHRYLVHDKGWLADPQFSVSITLAQAAPGPNVLFVPLLGWHVGLNAGGYPAAAFGMAVCLLGILLPSSLLTYFTAQWSYRNRHLRAVRAFKTGLAPVVIALLFSIGWILATANARSLEHWRLWVVSAVTTLVVWRTRIHLLWLLGASALLGWLGWV